MRNRSQRAAFARTVRRARATVRKYGGNPPTGTTGKEKVLLARYERAMATLMEAALKWGSHYPPGVGGNKPKPLSL